MIQRGGLVVLLSLCIAMMLMILPLPDWARPFRPQWVTLILIYWVLVIPHGIGVGIGFLVGIAVDVLTGTLLGQHALGFSVATYATIKLHQRVRVFPLWQQSLVVLLLLLSEHLIALWVIGATHEQPPGLVYWIVPPLGALLWPWLFLLMSDIRRRFRVQ